MARRKNSPHRAWKGALELTINGVVLPVNVELYARVKKSRSQSFRNLAPSGQPVVHRSFDPVTGEEVDDVLKGVQLRGGKNAEYAIIPPEALEQIKEPMKSEMVKLDQLVRVETIAWDLAIDRFAVRPAEGVVGAGQAVDIVWNGLKATGLAYCSQVSLTGGMDAVLCVYADERGLWAALLPFEDELYDLPTHGFDENGKAGTLFAQAMGQELGEEMGLAFDHSRFESKYAARRQAAIDAVLAGENVVVTQAPAPKQDGPDLMALLLATVEPKKPKKTTTKKKVTA